MNSPLNDNIRLVNSILLTHTPLQNLCCACWTTLSLCNFGLIWFSPPKWQYVCVGWILQEWNFKLTSNKFKAVCSLEGGSSSTESLAFQSFVPVVKPWGPRHHCNHSCRDIPHHQWPSKETCEIKGGKVEAQWSDLANLSNHHSLYLLVWQSSQFITVYYHSLLAQTTV